MNIRILTALLLGSLCFLASCAPSNEAPDSGKLKVVCTTGMITDAARKIGGEHVEVTGLCGPGVDPHLYLATRADQKRLKDAELVLYHGIHLEGKMGDLLARISKSPREGQHITAVAEAIDKENQLVVVSEWKSEEIFKAYRQMRRDTAPPVVQPFLVDDVMIQSKIVDADLRASN